MANNYFEGTGVLFVKKVTPVITALFSGLGLDPDYPEKDKTVYIAVNEGTSADWDTIAEKFAEIRQSLGLALPDEKDDPGIADEIFALADHYKPSPAEAYNLLNFVEHQDFSDSPSVEELVSLAKWLDDGHGLSGFLFESAWTCSKPRLGEFGGHGVYGGKNIEMHSSSTTACIQGPLVDAALSANDFEAAAQALVAPLKGWLAAVADEDLRKKVIQAVADEISGA